MLLHAGLLLVMPCEKSKLKLVYVLPFPPCFLVPNYFDRLYLCLEWGWCSGNWGLNCKAMFVRWCRKQKQCSLLFLFGQIQLSVLICRLLIGKAEIWKTWLCNWWLHCAGSTWNKSIRFVITSLSWFGLGLFSSQNPSKNEFYSTDGDYSSTDC